MSDASPPSDLTKLEGLQLDQSDNRSRLPSLEIKRAIGGHLSKWIDATLDRLDPGTAGWAHASRVWGGIVVALYIGFWLQLESASSAAVTVAILAQPRRGHALSRAVYRVFGTLIGFAASITLVALFGQERVLMIAGVSAWLALCIFVSTYLEGGQSYGAVLSGYTVGLIAVANLDTPQAVFETGIARTAAIVVGVFVISCINDAFGSPSVISDVSAKLRAAATATQDFIRRSVRGESQCPASTIVLLRQIIGVRADIGFVASEFADGHARAAGARSAVSVLLCELATVRAVANAAKLVDPHEVETLLGAIRCGTGSCDRTSLELEQRLNDAVTDSSTTPERVLLLQRIADLSGHRARVKDGIEALAGQHAPSRDPSLPVVRDLPDALRSAIRVGI